MTRRNQLVVAFLLILALLLLTWYAREGDNGVIHQGQKLVLAVSAPLQTGVTYIVRPFSNFWGYLRDLGRLRTENKALKDEVVALRRQTTDFKEMEHENERLKGLLGFADEAEYSFQVAPVIGREAYGWRSVIEIGRGSASGVQKDLPVVAEEGVVGKVVIVTANTALVQLINDSKSGVSAQIQRTREVGVASGSLQGVLRLRFIGKDSQVKKGDEIITSGLGGIYPKGMPLGRVDEVKAQPHSLHKEISIRAAIDFSEIEEVMVLTDAPAPSAFSKKGDL